MRLWLLIVGSLFVQESVSTNVVLLAAYQQHYPLWIINCIFAVASVVDIYIGYRLGRWAHRRSKQGRGRAFTERVVSGVKNVLGSHGTRITIALFGFINFAYLNSFIFSWLDVSFPEVFIFTFIGNILWYGSQWLLVYGANSITPNPLAALGTVLALTVVVVIAVRYATRRLGVRRF